MEHKVLRTAEKLQKSHTKKHWLYRGLSVLAAGAVFCTTYALILPAITLDKDAICGYEEHTHTEDCYTSTGSWHCMDDPETYEMLASADYVAHTHDEYCYNEAGEFICPFADWDNIVEPHEHTNECYEVTVHHHDENCMELVQGKLICTLEESEGHIHDESCLGEESVLVCELPEHEFQTDDCYDSNGNIICGIENHVHTDDCYTTEPVNVCGLEEGDGAHTHVSTCYEYVTEPTCNIEEGAETAVLVCEKVALHTHTDGCYTDGALTCDLPVVIEHRHEDCYVAGEPVLTCELEEHTHTDDCYGTYEEVPGIVNLTANSGAEEVELTGNWAEDLVAVAVNEIGTECESDQAFVNRCLDKTDIPATTIPDYKNTVVEFIEEVSTYYGDILRTGVYMASSGDIVIHLASDGDVQAGIAYYKEETGEYGYIGEKDGVVAVLDWQEDDIVAWVPVGELDPKKETPETPVEDEIILDEDKWDPVAWQKLVDSGWFTYWEDYLDQPTWYDEETSVKDPATVDKFTGDVKNAGQIDTKGNSSSDQYVNVSKTIAGTDTENVFDVTLTVQTNENIETLVTDPDMAVVIVMDISNTMRDTFAGEDGLSFDEKTTKYQQAIEAAEKFVDQFAGATANTSLSQIGFVAFNTNAHKICGMTSNVNTEARANEFKNTLRTGTGNVVKGYSTYMSNGVEKVGDHNRFTNMEAGLKMAQDMLAETSNQHKFIVFLTDGLPTTYLKSGTTTYQGYDPYTPGTDKSEEGKFHNDVIDLPCSYGTDYSDRAAEKAQDVAQDIKADGIKIYSIGAGLSTFSKSDTENTGTGWEHILYKTSRYGNEGGDRTFNTIDRGPAVDNGINGMKSLKIYDPSYTAGDNKYFEHWLRTKIGSNFYEDCQNADALKTAFNNIFEDIQTIVQKDMTEAWTVTDPIPTDQFEYIGKVSETNVGEFEVPNANNTNTIHWDLKTATPTTAGGNGSYTYTYQVTFRVRLKNEAGESVFTENKVYETNGTTTLKYRVIQETTSGGSTSSSYKDGTIDFPLPSVHGYLGELQFYKYATGTNTGIPGATFTLKHDPNCTLCSLTQKDDWSCLTRTATSTENGTVTFSNIPSGHTYTLVETDVPLGYTGNGKTYTVTVSYDEVTVTESDGSTSTTWAEDGYIIYNTPNPELPATGGNGTRRYILIGVLLMSTAVLLYTVRRRQRE